MKLRLAGQRFNRLRVVDFFGIKGNSGYWNCVCDCGKSVIVRSGHLMSGATQSCGCLKVEHTKRANTTHGQTRNGLKTRAYRIWAHLRERCRNPNCKGFKYYGGNGRDVCDRWLIFENFFEDMGECPEGMTLERIDNTKGYYKENCRWATQLEQANNKSNTHWIDYKGEIMSLPQWARRLGMQIETLRQRINKLHWSIERALTTPVRHR